MSTQRSMQRTIRRTLLAMALVALGATGTALAQPVPVTFGDTIEGTISNSTGTPSVNVYSFVAGKCDVVTGKCDVITIDINTSMFNDLDTHLTVVDPLGQERTDLGIKQDDPESTNEFDTDSYAQFEAKPAGTWQFSVTHNPAAGFKSGGDYELLVTRKEALPPEKPEYMSINIDIKPENRQKTTPIKKGERHIRVALLSSRKKGFVDPFDIDVHSLKFGLTGTESSFVRCAKRGKDRNGDRKPDRVCRFDIATTGLTLGNTVGMVTGKTRDNKAFRGVADAKVLAQKHHHKHHGGNHHHDDDDDDD